LQVNVLDLNALGLLAYILVSGLRSTVLKGLQQAGAAHPIGGENPISFCNVFLISQATVGLAIVLGDGRKSFTDIDKLDRSGRWLIAADAFFGCFLAPMSFFLALDKLSVVTQTLLFSLSLPFTAAIATLWLREKLPDRFWWSLALIVGGLLIGKLFVPMSMQTAAGRAEAVGIAWALVSMSSLAFRNSLRRKLAPYPICRGLSAGIPNLAGAVAFGIIALQQYGPQHFFYLSFWWVLGVIGLYSITLCLGSELFRQFCQRRFPVTQVGLASSSTLVVTVLSAALFLGEPLHPATIVSMVMILLGVTARFLFPVRQAG
jgi:drug/metabolite transporter (DMT)-like permease